MPLPYKIFLKHFSKKNIQKVYSESIRNKPSVGIDGKNIDCFDRNLKQEIEIIHRKILKGSYDFSFYKEKLILKGKNKYPRVISIPTIRDKIVLKIIFNILKEIYKDNLNNELVHTKVEKIKTEIQSGAYDHYIKMDIENFYPTISHKLLLKTVRQKTRKKQFIDILSKAISQETVSLPNKNKNLYSSKKGVPQGLSISNILATIYLLSLDEKHGSQPSYKYFRYVDDILILCRSTEADTVFNTIFNDFKNLELSVHKLGVSTHKTDKGFIADGFYFLGYRFSDIDTTVRENSVARLHDSIINIFAQYRHSKDKNIELLIWKLNLKITGCRFEGKKYGWLYFFSQINDSVLLFKLDSFVASMAKKFKVNFEGMAVKKFSRTYYEILKNNRKTTYIPNFSNYDFEMKKKILLDVFGYKKLKDKDVEKTFKNVIYKNIKEVEKDIQLLS